MNKLDWRSWLLLLQLVQPQQAVKVWVPSTSLQDASNWGSTGLPGACDRLVLTQAQDITLQMSSAKTLRVKSVTLPRQGIVTFADKSILQLNTDPCSSENVKDKVFEQGSSKGWLDPQNWNDPNATGWVPHSHRVPCAYEDVMFPPGRALTVVLPSILVPPGSISVKGKVMKGEAWSSFLMSEEGFEQFKGPDDVRGLDWWSGGQGHSSCVTPKFCYCGANAFAIRDWSYRDGRAGIRDEAICMYVKLRCVDVEAPPCYAPVYPEGHCCGVCGALVNVHDGMENGIPLDSVKPIVNSVLQDYQSKSSFYVGRRYNGDIQIVVLAQDGDSSDSFSLAREISAKLRKENIGSLVGLSYSGYSKNSTGHPALGIVFGTLIAVVSFFASVYYIYIVLPTKKWSSRLTGRDPFTFARFQNTLPEAGSHETLVLDPGHGNVRPGPANESFANPLYCPDGAGALTAALSAPSNKQEEMPLQETFGHTEMEQLIPVDVDTSPLTHEPLIPMEGTPALQPEQEISDSSDSEQDGTDSFFQLREVPTATPDD